MKVFTSSLVRFFVAFFYNQNVSECLSSFGSSIFASQSVFCNVQTSWDSVVAVDYGEVSAVQCWRQSSSFDFLDIYVIWVFNDILFGSVQAGTVSQFDDTFSLQQL